LQVLCTFIDDHMRRFGHHIGHRAAVLGLVKALRYASTRSAGPWALTTPAPLEGSTYVMAEETRCVPKTA